ncbi:hypothetical protein BO99DRAFT_443732 [Aspergillus violaceofuscus CBS 115571]|uniref:Ubiquitin-like domain-containing protein n=1 Tax=Aspergillus violaceofuscus (strain CBS 115571) TaxID=1450538 RepID=A0A2V5IG88_ASPV1|nr:hypothetical protein BO99DRAFT_443732 [Aspergillus violaceofuscus CBS 115571]
MEDEQPYSSIAQTAKVFLESTHRCIEQPLHLEPRELMLLQDQVGRFSIWASETGVFAPRRASLDHRLRYVPEIQRLVQGLLETLHNHLRRYLLQPKGKHDLSAIAKDLTLLHRLSNTIRKASRESQNLRAAADFRIEDEDGNDVGPAWRVTFAAEIIRRKWPMCENFLKERLATAMLLRRKRVLYRRLRHNKAGETSQSRPGQNAEGKGKATDVDNNHATKREKSVRSTPESEATTSATTVTFDRFKKASVPSVVGPARTTRMNTQEESLYPPAPKGEVIKRMKILEHQRIASIEAPGQSSGIQGPPIEHDGSSSLNVRDGDAEFARPEKLDKDREALLNNSEVVCPYCCCTLLGADVMDDRKWRNHLKHDLDAYVCLFEECAKGDILYSHSEAWLSHMGEHKVRWRCTAKAHGILVFKDKVEYLEHIRNKHKGTESQLDYLTERGSQPSNSLFETCPLCSVEATTLNMPVEDHIASHLRYIALLSLPFVEHHDQTPGADGSGQSSGGDVGSRSTLEDDESDRGLSLHVGDELDHSLDSNHDEPFAADTRSEAEETGSNGDYQASDTDDLSASAKDIVEKNDATLGIGRIIKASDGASQSKEPVTQERVEQIAQEEGESTHRQTLAAEDTSRETTRAIATHSQETAKEETADISSPKKPSIRFKDAVGRVRSFPFDQCRTWKGMESLIRLALLHDVLGSRVTEGHYDLVGPDQKIILPQDWDTVIEPGWDITMRVWPVPEEPVTPLPADPRVPSVDPPIATPIRSGTPITVDGYMDEVKDDVLDHPPPSPPARDRHSRARGSVHPSLDRDEDYDRMPPPPMKPRLAPRIIQKPPDPPRNPVTAPSRSLDLSEMEDTSPNYERRPSSFTTGIPEHSPFIRSGRRSRIYHESAPPGRAVVGNPRRRRPLVWDSDDDMAEKEREAETYQASQPGESSASDPQSAEEQPAGHPHTENTNNDSLDPGDDDNVVLTMNGVTMSFSRGSVGGRRLILRTGDNGAVGLDIEGERRPKRYLTGGTDYTGSTAQRELDSRRAMSDRAPDRARRRSSRSTQSERH